MFDKWTKQMNFGEIRTKFIDLSGRFDLAGSMASTPYTDGGSDFFIGAGQRYLDNHQMQPKSLLRFQEDIALNGYTVEFKDALAIKEVWYTKSDSRKALTKVSLGWMKENYSYPYSAIASGTPKYYTVNIIGLAGQQDALTTSNYGDTFTEEYQDVHFSGEASSTHQYYRGILIMPPVDTAGTITVLGHFKSKELSANGDTNFWTVNYPELLIQAANYSLESFYRNTEGAKDWKNIIDETLVGIDYNLVEEEISGVNRMEEELETINDTEEFK
jgi:hypothetical protein